MSEFHVAATGQPLQGTLQVPADKSISHRAAILSTLAVGETRIENFLASATTHATLDVLRALGAEVNESEPGVVVVNGRGLHGLGKPREVLFCAGSGTTIRLAAGVCAGQDFLTVLDGTPTLRRRPMARIVEPLTTMGANILARDNGKFAPLAIRGCRLAGIDYQIPVASAQVKSAILLASLFADTPTRVVEPSQSRDHTERMLQAFGAHIQSSGTEVQISPPSMLSTPQSIHIPNDISSAAFFVVAALLVPGSSVHIQGVGVNPTRTGLLDVLAQMGASIKLENAHVMSGEPVADLVVEHANELRGIDISGEFIPRTIDEFPILAVAATQARGETRVRDAGELRMKESNRIDTLASELRKLGAAVEAEADGFVIAGPTPLIGANVSAHNDHRLAMALAVAGLISRGETVIEGWDCVADSFPNFGPILSGMARVSHLAKDHTIT